MDVPARVQSALDGEEVAAHVPLRGDDELYVSATRTLIYRADGLLSDESVEEYGHDVERIAIEEGRRKATLRLDYGLDGERSFAVPASNLDDVFHSVLAGVLSAVGVTDAGETVVRTYRFSELTLVVTDARLVKHVGSAAWDAEYEEIPYETVTGIDVEEGSVATQLVLETTERTERIKAPADRARDVHEHVERALFAHHDVESRAEFERSMAEDADAPLAVGESGPSVADGDAGTEFDDGLAPIGADEGTGGSAAPSAPTDDPADADRDGDDGDGDGDGFADTDFETATSVTGADGVDAERVESRLRELHRTVEEQRALLDEQREVIEELAAELDLSRDQ